MLTTAGEKVRVPPAPTNTLVVAAKPVSAWVSIIIPTAIPAHRKKSFIVFMLFHSVLRFIDWLNPKPGNPSLHGDPVCFDPSAGVQVNRRIATI
jgi:hypothetical protein